jgi:hypothetical protein
MRVPGLILVSATLLLAALAARAASSDSLPLPPSVPAPDDWATPHLPKLLAAAPALEPTAQIDAEAFLPKNLLLSIATLPPSETRTPAQLEARLAAYVGTWRGESTWYSTTSPKILHYPTEMVYRFEQQNGQRVLTCVITYTINGAASVNHARLWVENGHIVSEVVQDGSPLRYIARTDHENLVWSATDSVRAALDFGEVETLSLTAGGGQITTLGFEVQHGTDLDAFVHEASVLQLVK